MYKEIHYLVGNKVFATEQEAHALRMEIFRKTNTLIEVRATKRKVTHTYEIIDNKSKVK